MAMMPRAKLVVPLLLVAAAVAGVLLLRRSPENAGVASARPGASLPGPASTTSTTGSAAFGETRHDRHARDELRRKILESWARAAQEAGTADDPALAAGGTATTVLAARAYGEDQKLDKEYIQHVMREDLFPLARQCYEQFLERQPDAGGRVTLSYSIVGDADLGGYVDDTSIDAGAPDDIQDPEMQTCMRESMNSVSFAPPKTGGAVTVVYPIEFAP